MMKVANVALALSLLVASAGALAQEPVQNIDPQRHGNLAAAQDLVRQAYDRLSVAQRENGNDLGGHAEKAKALLQQANLEIRLAADAANQR
jgi:cellobiose-specific phosphotransferase system component IIA